MNDEFTAWQRAIPLPLAGSPVQAICRALGRTEAWFHKWWRRYLELGAEGLLDLTRARHVLHRILFLPLAPGELTPPYWSNRGTMAISTLAGVRLVEQADRMPLLGELQPFLRGMTLLFWATAT